MSLIKSNLGGLGGSGAPGGALGSFFSQTIDQSLRFNDDDSAALSKTFSTAQTNTKKITVSVWVKRGNISNSRSTIIFAKSSGAGRIAFENDNTLLANAFDTGYNGFTSSAVFRDTSAWYHIVYQGDSTESTAANRHKVYVNGVQQTNSVSVGTPQDATTNILKNGNTTYIGRDTDDSGYYFDGYLAELNVIDGSIVAHTQFGETKDGVWIPKQYSGSYGNNGFYLPFSQDRTVGASAFFDEDDNSYVSFSDSSLYDIGTGDDFTLEFFFWPTVGEASGDSNALGYYGGTGGPYFALQMTFSSRNFYLYYGNGQAYTFGTYASGAVAAGRWHHVAVNRASGTLELFLDGTRVGSSQTSNTQAWDTTEFRINKAHNGSNNTYDGYFSNVRLVIGSAVYSAGSSITVPTSPLTDITNTKLLACTTTTITQDASSNNVTGTANGTAGTGYYATDGISPFPNSSFNEDASGNSNDFSANNLLDTDVVPDSPTNNFATMNPLMIADARVHSSAVYSEGNLKVACGGFSTSTIGGGYSTIAIPKDKKIYCEIVEPNKAGNLWGAGVIIDNHVQASNQIAGNGAIAYYNRSVYLNGTENDYGSSGGALGGLGVSKLAAGDVLGIAVDGTTGKVWFHRNGTYFGEPQGHQSGAGTTGNPSAGTNEIGTINNTASINPSGEIFIFLTGNNTVDDLFINFGQDSTFGGNKSAGSETDSEGIGTFQYAVPTDYVSLCAANLTTPAISPTQSSQADDHFNTVLFTGDGSSSNAITGVGFQPDWVWIKSRNNAQGHLLTDSVRGATKRLQSDTSSAEDTSSGVTSFDSDGFTMGSSYNQSSYSQVSWNWKAGGSASSNSDGSITSSVSANTAAGFSIVSYTGTGSNGTIGHGLTSAPESIWIKARTRAENWLVYHKFDGGTDGRSFLNLNLGSAKFDNGPGSYFQDTPPTASVFYQNTSSYNQNTDTYIAYCFHSVEGYSKVGSYTGNANADGTFVYLGFRPRWLLFKDASNTNIEWNIYYDEASPFNVMNDYLAAASSSAEATNVSTRNLDFLSNGFKLRDQYAQNYSANFIYLAFAEAPFKFANAR